MGPYDYMPRIYILLSACVTLLFILSMSEAKIGYDINVVVNNSTMQSSWSKSQSTAKLTFLFDGACTGMGRSSKYLKIDGFAGIGMKENTYTGEGRLICKDQINLISEEGHIDINEKGDNNSERYTCKINASLPTTIYNTNDIYYRGSGIHTRNIYKNNENIIYTNYYSDIFLKSVRYAGTYNDERISAEVTPEGAKEIIRTNPVVAFDVSSTSDQYSGIGFISDNTQLIEDRYMGTFTINEKIIKKYDFNASEEETDNWLGCMVFNDTFRPNLKQC